MLELCRICVELFAPGARINGDRTVAWYAQNEPYAKRIIFPVMPIPLLMDIDQGAADIKRDMAHVRFTPIGTTFTGPMDGVMDQLLSQVRLDYFLGDALPAIVNHALMKAPPYNQNNRTSHTWIGVFDVEQDEDQGKYMGVFDMASLQQVV